jgi:hypothetical protein
MGTASVISIQQADLQFDVPGLVSEAAYSLALLRAPVYH